MINFRTLSPAEVVSLDSERGVTDVEQLNNKQRQALYRAVKEDTMQVHTYDDIMALEPCFDPAARGYCTLDWQGTALDVLCHSSARAQDKLWVVLREDWIPAHVLHEFACQCAERALARAGDPDPRSVAAIETKRAWLRGEATDDELAAARDAAWDAAGNAARDAAWDARDAWAAQVDLLIALID